MDDILDDGYEVESWVLGNDIDCETCGTSWNEAEFDPHFSGRNNWSFHYRVGCYNGDSLMWEDENREERLSEMFEYLNTFPGWSKEAENTVRGMIEKCESERNK